MLRVLIVILIIAAIGYLWYQMQARKAAEQERKAKRQVAARAEPVRSLPPVAAAPVVPPVSAPRPAEAVAAPAVPPAEPVRDPGRFQDAADTAAGIGLDEQTEQMEDLTAGLAAARRDADAAAARLAVEADAALAEVRAAGQADADQEAVVVEEAFVGGDSDQIIDIETTLLDDREGRRDIVAQAIAAADADSVPPGAIRGDGGSICPPVYPIKGNAQTMLYHVPNNPTYAATIPELCFSNVEAAAAAGYQEARH